MKQDLTPETLTQENLRRITEAILAGDRIEATNICISTTGCGLTDAQSFIKRLTAGVKSTEQEKQTVKQQKRRIFWHRLISPSQE